MRVSLSPSLNQNKTINNLNKNQQTSNFIGQVNQDSVSFGSATGLIYLVARGGLDAIKASNKSKGLVNVLDEIYSVTHGRFVQEERVDVLFALSKLADNGADKGFWADCHRKNDGATIANLQLETIGKYSADGGWFRLVKDDSSRAIQAKKEFLHRYLDDGAAPDFAFVRVFVPLNKSAYKSFKEEALDKILYSSNYTRTRKERNSGTVDSNDILGSGGDGLRRNILELIDTLDPNIHSDYLSRNFQTIVTMKKMVLDECRGWKVAQSFWENFRPEYGSKNVISGVDEYSKILWEQTCKACNYDKAKIAKALGLKEQEVAEMLAGKKS